MRVEQRVRCVRSASAMRPGPGGDGGLEERKGGQLHCDERKVITKACGYALPSHLTSSRYEVAVLCHRKGAVPQ